MHICSFVSLNFKILLSHLSNVVDTHNIFFLEFSYGILIRYYVIFFIVKEKNNGEIDFP